MRPPPGFRVVAPANASSHTSSINVLTHDHRVATTQPNIAAISDSSQVFHSKRLVTERRALPLQLENWHDRTHPSPNI